MYPHSRLFFQNPIHFHHWPPLYSLSQLADLPSTHFALYFLDFALKLGYHLEHSTGRHFDFIGFDRMLGSHQECLGLWTYLLVDQLVVLKD